MSYLNKIGITPEKHMKDNYWIPLKDPNVVQKIITTNDKNDKAK